eukprot:TRINITY_DN16046_c0_g1_i1.p1 TRINITY_DN16046_c0_g1~~TRINITY_DN16046_c0_g1_i1.p1  ORF type:complete len:267 (+),score=44.98 TRINITY_DN16046_c0_g1_i1:116-916(+)
MKASAKDDAISVAFEARRRQTSQERSSFTVGVATVDDVEKAIAALEQTVKACRWQPSCVGDVALCSSACNGELPDMPVIGGEVGGNTFRLSDDNTVMQETASDHQLLDEDRGQESLLAEVRRLRSALRDSDIRLQALTTEVTSTSSIGCLGGEGSSTRYRDSLQKSEADAVRLQRDNKRLERSLYQAGVEERRLAEEVRSAPQRAEASLAHLRAECSRFEKENQEMENDIGGARAELGCMREDVERMNRHCARSGSPALRAARAAG